MMRLFAGTSSADAADPSRQDLFICMKLASLDTADVYNSPEYILTALDILNNTGEPRMLFERESDALNYLRTPSRQISAMHCVYRVNVPSTAIDRTSSSGITLKYKVQPDDFLHTYFHPFFIPLTNPSQSAPRL